jgi:undecaprenyl-diphosphatase
LRETKGKLNKNSWRRELFAVLGLAVLTIAISLCARWELRFTGDLQLTLLMQSIDNRVLLSLSEWVSYLTGSWRAVVLVIACGTMVWFCLGRLEGGLVLLAGLSSLLDYPIKVVVNRPRPTPDLVKVFVVEHGSGFPSGHTLFAGVFLGFLAYLAYTHLRNRSLRTLSFVGIIVLIFLIGASRVYLGVHWPSDVLGGYLAGVFLLALIIWLRHTWKTRLAPRNTRQENKGKIFSN